jgi:hypothetical protein
MLVQLDRQASFGRAAVSLHRTRDPFAIKRVGEQRNARVSVKAPRRRMIDLSIRAARPRKVKGSISNDNSLKRAPAEIERSSARCGTPRCFLGALED